LLELTELADLLPVSIQDRNDLVYGEHTLDDTLQSEPGFHDIAAPQGEDASLSALWQRYGIPAFNQVSARPGSHTLLRIHDQPLLVTGTYGQGRTVSFTGFTPTQSKGETYVLGQQLIRTASNRAYFETFVALTALASGRHLSLTPGQLLDATEKPLFQTLKEQPEAHIAVSLVPGTAAASSPVGERQVVLKNGSSYAHLVRLRVEWGTEKTAPYLTEFNDNAFELLPGEEKTIHVSWRLADDAGAPVGVLVVDGENADPVRIQIN